MGCGISRYIKRLGLVLCILFLCSISPATPPELLSKRDIVPEERDQTEEQRYRDDSQKQTQELLSKLNLIEYRLDKLEKEVANLSLGTIDSVYVMFSDTASVQNNNKNVNAFLTPSDTLYIDTTDLIE